MKKKVASEKELRLLRWAGTISKERVKMGVCRHCGGPVPCWSDFGDIRVGVRKNP